MGNRFEVQKKFHLKFNVAKSRNAVSKNLNKKSLLAIKRYLTNPKVRVDVI